MLGNCYLAQLRAPIKDMGINTNVLTQYGVRADKMKRPTMHQGDSNQPPIEALRSE
jgi:hypothetical protein